MLVNPSKHCERCEDWWWTPEQVRTVTFLTLSGKNCSRCQNPSWNRMHSHQIYANPCSCGWHKHHGTSLAICGRGLILYWHEARRSLSFHLAVALLGVGHVWFWRMIVNEKAKNFLYSNDVFLDPINIDWEADTTISCIICAHIKR